MTPSVWGSSVWMAVLLGCAGPSARTFEWAQPATESALREDLESIRREFLVPGIAVAVIGRAGVLVAAAVGRRRVDEPAALLSSDVFHLGSNTKAMTAFLVARLVQRGLLRWETTLAEAFPEWSVSMHEGYRRATLADLLRHRAGMPALTSSADSSLFEGIEFELALDIQRSVFARNVLHRPPATAPGEYLYSNAGYVVVGAVLERHLGKPWEDLMREEIFGPLRMRSCGFGPPVRGLARGQPFGHTVQEQPEQGYVATDEDNPPLIGPAGTVHCSLEDWGAFVRANMDAPPAPVLLEPRTVALLHHPVPLPPKARKGEDKTGYAMGWGTGERAWAGGRVLAHDGSNTSNLAAVRLAPRRGLAFLIAVNAGDERAHRAVARAYEALVERCSRQ